MPCPASPVLPVVTAPLVPPIATAGIQVGESSPIIRQRLSYYDLVDSSPGPLTPLPLDMGPQVLPEQSPPSDEMSPESIALIHLRVQREEQFLEDERWYKGAKECFGSSPSPNPTRAQYGHLGLGRMSDHELAMESLGRRGNLKWEAPPGIDITNFVSRGSPSSLYAKLKKSLEEESMPKSVGVKPPPTTAGKRKHGSLVRDQRDYWGHSWNI